MFTLDGISHTPKATGTSLEAFFSVDPFAADYDCTFAGHRSDSTTIKCWQFDHADYPTHRHCAVCDLTVPVEQSGPSYGEVDVVEKYGFVCSHCNEICCEGCRKESLCVACFDEFHGLSDRAVEATRALETLRDRINAEGNYIAILEVRPDLSQMRTLLNEIERRTRLDSGAA